MQIILKFYHAGQSYGLDINMCHNVTLTFKLTTWFLHDTRCLVILIILQYKILNPAMQEKVTSRTRVCLTLAYHKVFMRHVTLIFKLMTWFLNATHCLVMMIICSNLFEMQGKYVGQGSAKTHQIPRDNQRDREQQTLLESLSSHME